MVRVSDSLKFVFLKICTLLSLHPTAKLSPSLSQSTPQIIPANDGEVSLKSLTSICDVLELVVSRVYSISCTNGLEVYTKQ